MGGCLATDWVSFPSERVTKPLLETGVCLAAYRIATAVLIVCFEISAQQWVYMPQYISEPLCRVGQGNR
jgi:hypothetical protein